MRSYTADSNEFSLPATIRWKNRSISPKSFAQKQVRNLMKTNNVSVFLDKSTINLESEN